VNGRFLQHEKPTGVQRWAREVLNHLLDYDDLDIRVIIPSKFFAYGLKGHFWEQFILPFRCSRKAKLISLANWGPILKKNQILIVHDLIPISNPEYFSKLYALFSRVISPTLINRCENVATVSKHSADMISSYSKKKSEEISVLGAASSSILININEIRIDLIPMNKYLLLIGGDNSRKNLNFILSFWASLAIDHNLTLIVVVGRSEFVTKNIQTSLSINELIGVRYISNPSDSELSNLYSSSVGLLSPSVIEGFGLPLLESMSHGKPFLSTDTGAARDLCVGNSQILPLVREAWTKGVENLISTNSPEDRMIQLRHASHFSWDLVVAELRKLVDVPGSF